MIRNFGTVQKIKGQPQGILLGMGTGGNSTPADVYVGKTFTNDNGEQIGTNPYKSGMTVKGVTDLTQTIYGGGIDKNPTISGANNLRGIVVGTNNLVYMIRDYSQQSLLICDLDLNLISTHTLTSQGTPISKIIIDSNNNIYFGTSNGKVVKLNTSTKVYDFALSYNDATYSPKDVHLDSVDNCLYVAILGNLGNKNLAKITLSGTEIWSKSAVMVNGYGVTTDADGNVYYGGSGNSGNSSTIVLVSYTQTGVLRWQKTYADIPGVSKVLYNKKTNVLYAISSDNRKIYTINPATGAVISTKVINEISEIGIAIDDDGILYVKHVSTSLYQCLALDNSLTQTWSTTGMTNIYAYGMFPYNDFLYMTLFDNSSNNLTYKLNRYNKYTLK